MTGRKAKKTVIRVAVIESKPLALQAILATLTGHSDIDVVATSPGTSDLLQLASQVRPDVIIFDVGLILHDFDAVSVIKSLRDAHRTVAILALISGSEGILVCQLIKAGVRGCLLENDEQLLSLDALVRRIAKGERVYSQQVIAQYFNLADLTLTSQEQTILRLIADGLSNRQIAQQLGLSSNTIRNGLSAIYVKLGIEQCAGLNRRVDAINKARQSGLL